MTSHHPRDKDGFVTTWENQAGELEAVGLNTDEGLPPRVARDELQRGADEIYAADRAEEFNRGERS